MLPKISRYLLVFVAIFVMSYIIPSMYKTFFDVRVNKPNISYSVVNEKFYLTRYENGQTQFVDEEGNSYTREKYMEELPINNFYYHLGKGTFPDSLMGLKLNPNQLRIESFYQGTGAIEFSMPEYGLNPMFESASDFGISLPKDVFRINDRMEFIRTKTNEIDEEKSEMFTEAMKKEGFEFPAAVMGGIPSFMKSRDDGWFIQDKNLKLFHVKMVKGAPFVKSIPAPEGLEIQKIVCSDHQRREFYATIFDKNGGIYLILNDGYKLQKLPVEKFDSKKQSMMMNGNLFNKTIVFVGDESVDAFVIDRDFNLVDKHQELLPKKSEMTFGKVKHFLFPFVTNLEAPNSLFVGVYGSKSPSLGWMILSAVLVIITLIFIKRQNKSLKNNLLDIALVFLTGIFGFIAVHMFPNKEY